MTDKIVLPLAPVKATFQSPNLLIIFSKPKMGKTGLAAALENALLMDTENGSDFVDAMKLKVKNVDEISKVGQAIKEAGYPYKYIVVDTATGLEEMCVSYAETLYSRAPIGKNWFKTNSDGKLDPTSGKSKYGSILNLPDGNGYSWLREAYSKILNMIKKMAPRVILLGHVKDVKLDVENLSSLDLDLTGKIKRITVSQSDAIGYLYRKGENQNYISFKAQNDVLCGARPVHLRNQDILISEMTENGLVTYWDKIFID